MSASDGEKNTDMSSEKSEDDEKVTASFEAADAYPSLMVQRVQKDHVEDKGQRWNIFQSECKINNTNCKLIIDGGSYTNAVSKELVEALGLPVWKHPQPHHVEWMYHTGKLKVTHKVRVKFSVGDYTDMVICDVISMEACHLLLGRPWQYDHGAAHDGRSNTYSFWYNGKQNVLRPMFANAIKVDANVSPQQKIAKAALKPSLKTRMASIQEGEDDARNNGSIIFPVQNTTGLLGAAPHTEQKTQSIVYFDANISGTSRYNLQHVLQVGSFCFEVPPIEPKKDLVTPNFRTPPG